eukprot:CAMPEP_0178414814 /NCGR_PEP_ID=MMETSP0689_2-20121128/23229_1 /TAXON_ID=160604 /ORGANISM="Amphidinium massartii, Strain CS-259" /LENGTH=609 /DNA_ID=CAMNT_0020036113 /DNA_START=45 /DNA_END=1870 /DNA_ORIENTATION=-
MAVISSLESLNFNVKAQGMDLCFDPVSQQQFVSFKLALQMSVQELISNLKVLQAKGEAGAGHLLADGLDNSAATSPASGGLMRPPMSAGSILNPQMPAPGSQSGVFLSAAGMSAAASNTGSPLDVPVSPALAMNDAASIALLAAASCGSAVEVKAALEQNADVNVADQSKQSRTPLHLAVEAGGNPEVVNMLLEARANVNATTVMGRTPLHNAVERYLMMPPVVVRMLTAAKADLNAVDSRGAAPIDMVKAAAQLTFQQRPREDDVSMRQVLQLLDEVTDLPTVAIPMLDQEVRNVVFADMEKDKVVWHTDSTIGLYSLRSESMLFRKRLRPGHLQSCVLCISANPIVNTIAACLEITEAAQGPQNVAIVWPNGQLQDEEPLKLNLGLRPAPAGFSGGQAQLMLSQRGPNEPQLLVGRLGDGKVYVWRLNASRTQLLAEVKLMNLCGMMAVSDSATWVAGTDQESDGEIVVLRADKVTAQNQTSQKIASIKKRPACIALAERTETSALLAVTGPPPPGLTSNVIEVLEVTVDGGMSTVYRVKPESLCSMMQFCHDSCNFLASAHADGLVALYNLSRGEVAVSHDDPELRSMSISPDRLLVATAQGRHFR